MYVTCISELKLGVVCTLKVIPGFLHDHKTGYNEQAAKFPCGPRNVLLQPVGEQGEFSMKN